jgi:hypothetical protein
MKRLPLVSHALFCAVSLSFAAAAAQAKDGATGTITIDGKSWPVADAVAVMDGEDLEIVFGQAAFDRVKWADDGEFDSFDLTDFKDGADGQSLTIDIDEEDGGYGGHNVRYSPGSTSGGYSSDYEEGVKLTTRSAERVAGTVKFADAEGGLGVDVSFDLPVTKTGKLARAGTPLPADGGEPGKALRAAVDATLAGDVDKMTAMSHPDRRAAIEEAKKAGEIDQMLQMAKLFTPKITKITGGTVDGDRAWVEFEGDEAGSKVTGTGEMSRLDGKWYLESINTRSGS